MKQLVDCELRRCCGIEDFHFDFKKEISPALNIIGQDRAIRAIETGLHTQADEFNICITGLTGTGKNSTIKIILDKLAPKDEDPLDWAYVYNFKERNLPLAISFKPGCGKDFYDDFDEFVSLMRSKISDAFKSEHYESEKNNIIVSAQTSIKGIYQEMNNKALEKGFIINTNPEGVATIPQKDGKQLTQEEFNSLDSETKDRIEQNRIDLQIVINGSLKKVQTIEKSARNELTGLDKKIAQFSVQIAIDDLKQKYNDNPKVISYLDEVKEDIATNIEFFKDQDKDEKDENNKKKENFFLKRYKVNLLVENKKNHGAPIVFEMNPTYYNLFGSIEYHQEMGSWVTDSSFIRGGSLLKANGGYIVLQIADLLSTPYVWEGLKRCLKSKQLQIENLDEQVKTIPTNSLKPQSIPLHTKIILIGSEEIYSTLYRIDEDFRKYFKIRAQFDYEMERNEKTEKLYASYIAIQCRRMGEEIKFSPTAIGLIINYGSRLAGHQEKLTTQFTLILDVVKESIHWAKMYGRKTANENDVRRTLKEKRYRGSLLEEKVHTSIIDNKVRIQTDGERVGQINGLSIIGNGEYMFGQPSRITATSFPGKGGVMSVDKESEMSGAIFDKGAMIINSFIAYTYGQKYPLPLSISLAFEQNYGGIDGDSASAAEVIVTLSAISKLPIRQDLAITGSMDQLGQIQPIGGANAKIEGFFDICDKRGLTGKQGVVVPAQNQINLMLAERVIAAVNKGLFHVYTMDKIEDAIELFFNKEPGELNSEGIYPENTVNFDIVEQLNSYHELEKDSRHFFDEENEDE